MSIQDQPPPKPNDAPAILDLVRRDIEASDHRMSGIAAKDALVRDKIGRERYGTPLQAGNGRDALVDAYQEAQDQTAYLRQAREELTSRDMRTAVGFLYLRSLNLMLDLRGLIAERDGHV